MVDKEEVVVPVDVDGVMAVLDYKPILFLRLL
jgi:hypothetical protein